MENNGYTNEERDSAREGTNEAPQSGEYSQKFVNGKPVDNAEYYKEAYSTPVYTKPTYSNEGYAENYSAPQDSYAQQNNVPNYGSQDGQQYYSQPHAPQYSAPHYDNQYAPSYTAQPTHETAKEEHRQRTRERYERAAERVKTVGASAGFRKFIAVLLIVLLCAAASGLSSYVVVNSMLESQSKTPSGATQAFGNGNANHSSSTQGISPVTGDVMAASAIYDMACEQVVGVNISVETTNIFGQKTSGAVSGSGFIISEDGYILTNYHVIEYSAVYGYEVKVILYNGTSYTGQIIGYDADNDLALLKIDASGLNAVSFGSSADMVVGETVYTVGNPLGELAYTMTSGIVSALDREISTEENLTINMFQIDAAVNEGNSGGPVFNSRGEVIGVVSAKYADTGVEGLAFAIPIDDASSIATQLAQYGYVTGKAYMGVSVVDSSRVGYNMGGGFQSDSNLPSGAYVYTVEDGSAANKAGIEVGDVITAIDNIEIASTGDLTTTLKENFKSGDSAVFTVYREGESIQLTLVFDEYKPA